MSRTELEDARREFERRWAQTRKRLDGELGLQLKRSGWLVLLLAGAVGVAAAVGLKSAKDGRRGELAAGPD